MTSSVGQWGGIALAIGIICLTLVIPMPHDKVVFLDVGQGDSILVQSGTEQILIDGGKGAKVLERLGEELPWYDHTVDVVISTHPDQDHLEGLLHVLEHYTVDLVVLPHMPHTTQLQEQWLKLLVERKIPYRFGWRGQRIVADALSLDVLGPFEEAGTIVAPQHKTNNAAVLTRVDFHNKSFLLTSDAEEKVETMLVKATNPSFLDVDILKAGHHGSKTSTSPTLLAATTPQAVVISVGKDNRYGHPHPSVIDRLQGVPLFRTDEQGSVRFLYDHGQWVVSDQTL